MEDVKPGHIPIVTYVDGELVVVQVWSYLASLEPIAKAYLAGHLTRREFYSRVQMLVNYAESR